MSGCQIDCGSCGNCAAPDRLVVVATFEVYGGTYEACREEATRLATMLDIEDELRVDLGPLRIAETVRSETGVASVTWEADAIVRAVVRSG